MNCDKKRTGHNLWCKAFYWAALAVTAAFIMLAGCGKMDKALPISMSADEDLVAEWLAQEENVGSPDGAQGQKAQDGTGSAGQSYVETGADAANGQNYASADAAAQGGTVQEGMADGTVQPTVGQQNLIYVHVCGAVQHAGVVELPEGSRGKDALEAAGGFAEEADREAVNLASVLYDGQKLYFPTEGEDWTEYGTGQTGGAGQTGSIGQSGSTGQTGGAGQSGSMGQTGGAGQTASGLVNINTADVALLCTLPGIGETRAKAIIAYREQKGSFGKIEDIMKVSGIKEGAFEKVKVYITVG